MLLVDMVLVSPAAPVHHIWRFSISTRRNLNPKCELNPPEIPDKEGSTAQNPPVKHHLTAKTWFPQCEDNSRHSKSRFFCAAKSLVLKFCARKSGKISLKIT
jgi:hypothetical protein